MKLVVGLVLCILALPAHAAAPPRVPLAFTHVTVIDGTDAAPKPDQTVLIAENRISAIGPATETPPPQGARVIDGRGKFLIPGLWDMHVHVLWEPAVDTLLPLMVANGVTGARDMHSHFSVDQIKGWIGQVESGNRIGPRIFFAGPILDGPQPIWPGSIPIGDAPTARRAVRDLKSKGVNFIKVYERLPREAYFAIADECKAQKISFCGHVPEAVTPAEASDTGQRSIEHLSHLLENCRVGEGAQWGTFVYDPAKAQLLFEKFKKNGTWQCPTLIVPETTTFGREERFAHDPRRKYLTRFILSRVGFDDSKRDWDATLHFWKEERKLARDLQKSGAELLAGTDAPIVRNVPGFSLHDELKCLVDIGCTPLQALQAATRNPARFFGKENEFGTIETGKRADMVLLTADPLLDIRNTTKIDCVVADGRLFDRPALDALLTEIRKAAEAPLPTTQGK